MSKILNFICYIFKLLLTNVILIFIMFYRYFISPYLSPKCRYTPTCSSYGLKAIKDHGPFKGIYLTCKRILKCNPWGGYGYDPVPPCKNKDKNN